jgi:hypothetical protein
MSIASGKVLLLRLYEKQSARGNQYWIGRLGAAKVVAFPNTKIELQYGAVGAIDVFVQAGNGDAGAGDRSSREPPQRQSQPPSDEPLTDPVPFDDDVSSPWEDDR